MEKQSSRARKAASNHAERIQTPVQAPKHMEARAKKGITHLYFKQNIPFWKYSVLLIPLVTFQGQ